MVAIDGHETVEKFPGRTCGSKFWSGNRFCSAGTAYLENVKPPGERLHVATVVLNPRTPNLRPLHALKQYEVLPRKTCADHWWVLSPGQFCSAAILGLQAKKP